MLDRLERRRRKRAYKRQAEATERAYRDPDSPIYWIREAQEGVELAWVALKTPDLLELAISSYASALAAVEAAQEVIRVKIAKPS